MRNPFRRRTGCIGLAAAIAAASLLTFRPTWSMAAAVDPRVEKENTASVLDRIRFLRSEIARLDELYHRKAQPEVSDFEYDQLKQELAGLEERFPKQAASLGASQVLNVGDDRTPGFPIYRHRVRMLSLEKTYSDAGLREFFERLVRTLGHDNLVFTVEPKFDGLAVSATYEHGQLRRVVTRGNGIEGDDVTVNARQISSLPEKLKIVSGNAPDVIEVRGEVFMSFAEFRRLNREREGADEAQYSSPRNLASGTLKSLDPRELAIRKLDVVFYGVGAFEPAAAAPESQTELLTQFRAWGLPTVDNYKVAKSLDAIRESVREFGRQRAGFTYPTDGAVVKLDSVIGQRGLGATERAPRWAIAFKFAPERVTTRLKSITLQVGRSGVITPVAELEPVRLDGALISRATLHNAAEIARRDIRVGDEVFLERMGEVIPAIVGVDLEKRNPASTRFVFPSKCPGCGAALIQRDGEVAWRCENHDCPAQLQRRLQHFASPSAVAIKGLGQSTIAALVDRGLVHELPDLYRLRREDLLTLPRATIKSSDGLLAAIATTKHVELSRFVYGLGIHGVGLSASRILARRFASLDAIAASSEAELQGIPGLGGETAKAVGAFFADARARKLLADFRSLGVAPTSL